MRQITKGHTVKSVFGARMGGSYRVPSFLISSDCSTQDLTSAETEVGEGQKMEVIAGKHVFTRAKESLPSHLESRCLMLYEMPFVLLGESSP